MWKLYIINAALILCHWSDPLIRKLKTISAQHTEMVSLRENLTRSDLWAPTEGNPVIQNATNETNSLLNFWQNRVSLSLFSDVLAVNNSIGVLGNVFIIYVFLLNREKLNTTNFFLLNLALSDFGYTSTLLIRGLSFYFTDITWLHPWLCKLW